MGLPLPSKGYMDWVRTDSTRTRVGQKGQATLLENKGWKEGGRSTRDEGVKAMVGI